MWRRLMLVLILILVGCSSGMGLVLEEKTNIQAPMKDSSEEKSVGEVDPIMKASEPEAAPTLTNLGQAPELTNEVWLNSDEPLRLAGLRGKVVLLEMWTFG